MSSSHDVLEHVARFGLTTLGAVRRLHFDGKQGAARAALDELVRDKRLFRQGPFYKLNRAQLSDRKLGELAAVLWYCCLTTPTRRLLSEDQVLELTSDVAAAEGTPAPRKARCYYDSRGYLALLRVHPSSNPRHGPRLNRALGLLQRYVNEREFRPWAHLASRGKLRLTYLMEDRDHAAEFARWLERRPLVSRTRNTPALVPAEVRLTRYSP